MTSSWLDTPVGAVWPDDDDPRSFVRYRRLLHSYHRALAAGWNDADFVDTIVAIDDAIAGVDGSGFRVTPAAWSEDLAGVGAPERVFAKDETGNVGGSHKARHLMGLLLHLAVDAVATDARLAISSCGNAALGAATVARAASRPIDVFIPTWADPAVVATWKNALGRIRPMAVADPSRIVRGKRPAGHRIADVQIAGFHLAEIDVLAAARAAAVVQGREHRVGAHHAGRQVPARHAGGLYRQLVRVIA